MVAIYGLQFCQSGPEFPGVYLRLLLKAVFLSPSPEVLPETATAGILPPEGLEHFQSFVEALGFELLVELFQRGGLKKGNQTEAAG